MAVAVDACGNIYVAGGSTAADGIQEDVLLKYDTEGTQLWERRRRETGSIRNLITHIALDSNANICVTGKSVTLGDPVVFTTCKYSPDGDLIWEQRHVTETSASSNGTYGMCMDASQNVFVAAAERHASTDYDFVAIKYRALPCVCTSHGDIIGDDGFIDILDIVGLIDCIFVSADPLTVDPQCPHVNRGDVTCDGINNVQDIVHLIDFVFRGGAAPCDPCACTSYPASCG
jgi:hypothetical protein